MVFLLTPFVKLMNRLKYPYKFALIGVVLLLPFVLSMYLIARHYEAKIEVIGKERAGMRLHSELNRLAADMRSLRTEHEAAADRRNEAVVAEEKRQIGERLESLVGENERLGDPFFAGALFKALSAKWQELQAETVQGERLERYKVMLGAIHKLMLAIADSTGTRADRNEATRFMAQMLIDRLAPMLGQIDEAAGNAKLAAVPSTRLDVSEQRGKVSVQIELLRDSFHYFRQMAEDKTYVSENGLDAFKPLYERMSADVEAFIGLLDTRLPSVPVSVKPISPQDIEEYGGKAIASGDELYETVFAALDARLVKQIHNEGLKKIWALLVTAAAFAGLGLLFVGFYVSVVHAVFALRQTSLEVASGQIRGRIRLGTEDELKEVEDAYNKMADAYSDIMRQQEAIEDHLQRRAYYDALTGAPNRFLFHERLGDAIAGAEKQEVMLGLMLVDLDGFKKINEASGHRIGDLLLRQVAERLTECLRETDMVARIDGDEFGVILPEMKNRQVAAFVADKLLRGFLTPFIVEGNTLTVSASIGISLFPDDGSDADSLMSKADMAMFSVKEQGRNGFRYYESNDRS